VKFQVHQLPNHEPDLGSALGYDNASVTKEVALNKAELKQRIRVAKLKNIE